MARATPVPVTGSVLAWALDEAGLDAAELAELLHVDIATVQLWLQEEDHPGRTQFRRIAAILKRPPSFFFLPEPPTARGLPPSFRHPPGIGGDRSLLRQEAAAIRRARRAQTVARWIAQRDERAPIELPSIPSLSAEDAAEVARVFLNWSLPEQLGVSTEYELVRHVRRRLESHGILVFHLPLSTEGCRGFSLSDDFAPAIAINTAYNAPARVFSYFHELGHLLRRSDAICSISSQTEEERWCEAFASAVLLPRGAFTDFVRSLFGDSRVSQTDEVSRIARHFRVSLRAAAVRLERLGLGVAGLYSTVDAEADFKRGGGGGGGGETRTEKRFREFGAAYSQSLLSAQRRGLLKQDDVAEYLNLSVREVDAFRLLATTEE